MLPCVSVCVKAELHSLLRAQDGSHGRLLYAAVGPLVPVLLQPRLRAVLLQVRQLLRVDGTAALTGMQRKYLEHPDEKNNHVYSTVLLAAVGKHL